MSHTSRTAAGRVRAAAIAATALSTVLAPSAGVAGALAAPARAGAEVHATVAALSNAPIVGMAPSGTTGYWLVSSTGGVFTFGTAVFHGSAGGLRLAKPIVGMAATPTGHGYWLVASDGGIFSFGDARYHGSTGGLRLNKPIVGMASTATGNGYWLVASDGGIFAFGDARFHGSTGRLRLHKPVVGMARTASGNGYWLVASDGGIFSFGDARFHGSTGGIRLAKPIVGMSATPTGGGYRLVASDGGVFCFGDATYHGSASSFEAARGAHAVGLAPVGAGYWVVNNLGQIDTLGAPTAPAPTQPVVSTATPASTPYRLPASVMPSASRAPSTAFEQACWVTPVNVSACDSAALSDINAARAAEGYGPLPLPANFESLPVASQLVAVANAERTSRGLPALPENSSVDSMAQSGAVAGNDPTGPSGYGWGSNIAWGDPTALSADFGWMYDDGPNSENVDCAPLGSGGCWGHRINVLAPWGGKAGGGVYDNRGTMQLTQLFVENY